jgi:hypothetical protein
VEYGVVQFLGPQFVAGGRIETISACAVASWRRSTSLPPSPITMPSRTMTQPIGFLPSAVSAFRAKVDRTTHPFFVFVSPRHGRLRRGSGSEPARFKAVNRDVKCGGDDLTATREAAARDQELSPDKMLVTVEFADGCSGSINTRFVVPDCPDVHYASSHALSCRTRPIPGEGWHTDHFTTPGGRS